MRDAILPFEFFDSIQRIILKCRQDEGKVTREPRMDVQFNFMIDIHNWHGLRLEQGRAREELRTAIRGRGVSL